MKIKKKVVKKKEYKCSDPLEPDDPLYKFRKKMARSNPVRKNGLPYHLAIKRKPLKKAFTIGDRRIWGYSITWLCAAMNLTVSHIYQMERLKVFPPPLLARGDDYFRWYLASEILGYAKIYKLYNPSRGGGYIKSGFKHKVWEFRARLRELILNDIGRIYDELPCESEVMAMLIQRRKDRTDKWRDNIDKLIV